VWVRPANLSGTLHLTSVRKPEILTRTMSAAGQTRSRRRSSRRDARRVSGVPPAGGRLNIPTAGRAPDNVVARPGHYGCAPPSSADATADMMDGPTSHRSSRTPARIDHPRKPQAMMLVPPRRRLESDDYRASTADARYTLVGCGASWRSVAVRTPSIRPRKVTRLRADG